MTRHDVIRTPVLISVVSLFPPLKRNGHRSGEELGGTMSAWLFWVGNDILLDNYLPAKYYKTKFMPQIKPTPVQISRRHRLNVCVIEKNLSTVLTAILCYLHNPQRFVERGRNITTEVFDTRQVGGGLINLKRVLQLKRKINLGMKLKKI